jgi:hypothetical protein
MAPPTTSRLVFFYPAKQENNRERIVIYSRAGVGKTRLALTLPVTEKWGEILYFAADDNSEFLPSINVSLRPRVHVIKPEGDITKAFQQFCMQNWKKLKDKNGVLIPDAEQPMRNVRTLVIDTYTTLTYKAMMQGAQEQSMDREPHYKIGDPNEGGVVIPNRGDYQGIEALSRGFIDTLFDKQRDYNIIFVCQEDWKEVAKGKFAGGPSHPGRKMLEDLPATFNTVIRLIREPFLVPGTQIPTVKVIAVTDNDGAFIAKLREGDYEKASPLARFPLDRNPINFWLAYDARDSSN